MRPQQRTQREVSDALPTVSTAAQRVIAAENQLAVTWERLNALRRAAFFGGRYRSDEYDRAVLAYHAAERDLRAARAAWLRDAAESLATSDLRAA